MLSASLHAQAKDMKTALVLIDIQNDYFAGGKMPLDQPEAAADKAQLILEDCRRKQVPIIHIQHLANRANPTFFIPNTPGAAINKRVRPLADETIIVKHYPNSFIETELLACLKSNNIEHLLICGMMTHMCVDATTRAAKDMGFNCTVVGDACATKSLSINNETVEAAEVQKAFLGALNYYYSSVVTADQYLNR